MVLVHLDACVSIFETGRLKRWLAQQERVAVTGGRMSDMEITLMNIRFKTYYTRRRSALNNKDLLMLICNSNPMMK